MIKLIDRSMDRCERQERVRSWCEHLLARGPTLPGRVRHRGHQGM